MRVFIKIGKNVYTDLNIYYHDPMTKKTKLLPELRDINTVKQYIKDTMDWYTEKEYIEKTIKQHYNENLADLIAELDKIEVEIKYELMKALSYTTVSGTIAQGFDIIVTALKQFGNLMQELKDDVNSARDLETLKNSISGKIDEASNALITTLQQINDIKLPITLEDVKGAAAKYFAGELTLNDIKKFLQSYGIPQESIDFILSKVPRLGFIGQLIMWINKIWEVEEQLEKQVDELKVSNVEELIEQYKDIPTLLKSEFDKIPRP